MKGRSNSEVAAGSALERLRSGDLLAGQDRLAEAAAAYGEAIGLDPALAEAHYGLAYCWHMLGDLEAAAVSYRQAVVLRPDYFDAQYNLGCLLKQVGSLDKAQAALRIAAELKPEAAPVHVALGNAQAARKDFAGAEASYRRALELQPGNLAAGNNLANVFREQGRTGEARELYERVLRLDPAHADAWYGLGIVLNDAGEIERAEAAFQRAITIFPGMAHALRSLGSCQKGRGDIVNAIGNFRRALEFQPENAWAFNSLFLAMQYAAGISPEALRAEHDAFAARFEAPLQANWKGHANAVDPERRLRIGYVSADFRQHSAAYFVEPLFAAHNRSGFEIVAYCNNINEDDLTRRFRRLADVWVPCFELGEEELAERIRADGIDILVDVSGHTAGNRLLTFARKPAPVQVTWLGYPCTTGLTAIDYRITDRHAEPEGMTEHLNVEKLWRLPDFFCCYRAHEGGPEQIDHLPADGNGYITFGCFNNFAKVTDVVLKAWAAILRRIPDARLLLELPVIDIRKFRVEIEARLQGLGLPLDRVDLELRKKSNQYVLYNRIDITLDPFPCNGGTTSLDSLWMGVPFVTLEGRHFVSRMGVSILTNAGLPELIAKSEEEYVDLAVRLATDREWLRRIRDGLRERVEGSPLMDADRFARQLEAAYREMWRRWCDKQINGASAESSNCRNVDVDLFNSSGE